MLKQFCSSFAVVIFAAALAGAAIAQSTDQAFPTAVTTNMIEASISARDIGDSRLTTYYYTFDSGQGDLFINIVSNNLTGDIDLFTLDTMLQLTKVSVYGDLSESETGRVVYFRKPEKLLLRIQGRTPNDEPATVTIKFAGSFIAAAGGKIDERPELPTVTAENDSGIVVNSVGTVIARRTKPEPENEVAKVDVPKEDADETVEVVQEDVDAATENIDEVAEPAIEPVVTTKPEVIVTENIEPEKAAEERIEETADETGEKKDAAAAETKDAEDVAEKEPAKVDEPEIVSEAEKKVEEEPVDKKTAARSLANIKLVVLFKDGTKIERPMDKILRFSVDNGVLTIISMDGSIGRYSIFDVERTTIE